MDAQAPPDQAPLKIPAFRFSKALAGQGRRAARRRPAERSPCTSLPTCPAVPPPPPAPKRRRRRQDSSRRGPESGAASKVILGIFSPLPGPN